MPDALNLLDRFDTGLVGATTLLPPGTSHKKQTKKNINFLKINDNNNFKKEDDMEGHHDEGHDNIKIASPSIIQTQ